MRILGRVERFIEGLVEGIFGRGADNLPAGILRRLATEIEKNLLIRGRQRWAPPDCHIVLTREAMRLVLPIQAELEEELRGALARFAAQIGAGFPSPLRFKFGVGDGTGAEIISVGVSFPHPPPAQDDHSAAVGETTEQTRIYHRLKPGRPYRAWLRIQGGADDGREFQLTEGRLVIGRDITAHINLRDPNVSRRHAVVICKGGVCTIQDLQSTNGTEINGRRIAKRRLRSGDAIKLGQTVMVFRCLPEK